MARIDYNFLPDHAFEHLRDLLRQETAIANSTASGPQSVAKAPPDNQKKTLRVVFLAILIRLYAHYRNEQHLVRISEIRLASDKVRDAYLRRSVKFSIAIAKSCEDLLADIPSDDPSLSSIRQLAERARAEEHCCQKEFEGYIHGGEKRRSRILGSSTKPPRGASSPLAKVRAKLRGDTIRLLYWGGYENFEIARTIYPDYPSDPDAATGRVATYVTRVLLPAERSRKSRADE